MRVKIKIGLAPFGGVQAMCEEAGLMLMQGSRKKGATSFRKRTLPLPFHSLSLIVCLN